MIVTSLETLANDDQSTRDVDNPGTDIQLIYTHPLGAMLPGGSLTRSHRFSRPW